MSWFTEILFPRRTAREIDLQARVQEADATAEAAISNQRRMAKDLEDRERRIEAQAGLIADLRAQLSVSKRPEPVTVTQLREELDAQKRVNNRLANQLLDAVGHVGEPLTESARAALGLPRPR